MVAKYRKQVLPGVKESGKSTREQHLDWWLDRFAGKMLAEDAPDLPLLFRDFATVIKPYVDGEIITPIDHNNPGDKFAETIKILKH